MAFKDRTGMRFGKLTVVEQVPDPRRGSTWKCKCDCGKERIVTAGVLEAGDATSCGCGRRTHGKTKTAEYRCWMRMKDRCLNKSHVHYSRYGGRGIVICQQWLNDFENFLADMGPKPSPKHSIDRIDNDGNYEPGNCRWATPETQQRNRRACVYLEYLGKRMTVTEWAEETGINRHAIYGRVNAGWSVERTLTQPSNGKRSSCSQSAVS